MIFSKYSGSGNDFILIDDRQEQFPQSDRAYIASLCQRQRGIGADGLILLQNSKTADFRMRIFNADGGEAEMCGNGIRCLAKFIRDLGAVGFHYQIETMQTILRVEEKKGLFHVEMMQPFDVQWDMKIELSTGPMIIQRLNTGVPHAVLFVDNLNEDKWMALAPSIRRHSAFGSAGTNVNFTSVDASGTVHLRTYERGVEGETLACGTGATATALAVARKLKLTGPIRVLPRSQEALEITFSWENETPTHVSLAGPANYIFSGEIK
ncbi:MAG: diaminopimelate epimerase [Parachlamydia sp.]|nr:diaminopimelate epimerase [Parachlamydia sp.]